MKDLCGINLAMQTPFNTDGSTDYVLYENLIEQYIEVGIHGIVLGAGIGQSEHQKTLHESLATLDN